MNVPRGTRLVTCVNLALLLSGSLIGCGEGLHHRPILGTRVHSFNVAGVPLTHCSILMRKDRPEESRAAIKVCEEELRARPEPEKGK